MEADALHDLTAAYALNALDAEDAGRYEAHLARCQRCQSELAELSESASALAYAADAPRPSPELRSRILERARAERPNVVPLRARWLRPGSLGCFALGQARPQRGGPRTSAARCADPRAARLTQDLVLARDARRRARRQRRFAAEQACRARTRPHLRSVGRRWRGSTARWIVRRRNDDRSPARSAGKGRGDGVGHRREGRRDGSSLTGAVPDRQERASELESGACFAANATPARPHPTDADAGSASSASQPSSCSSSSSA